MKIFIKPSVLFLIGGFTYYFIEILYRQYSHWTMFCLGAICFILIGSINEYFSWAMPLWKQCGIATFIIVLGEFITGCIVNLWLGWNVWNYDKFDLLGQICVPMIVVWYFLSLVGIVFDDICRWLLFDEEKPHYKIL